MTVRSTEIPVAKEESLHLRPMQVLNEQALVFESKVTLSRGGKLADVKSILELMLLAAETGPLFLEAEGTDADEAVQALADLLTRELSKE